MPRTAIPVDVVPRYGGAVVPTGVAADATNDHDVENNGQVILLFEQSGAATPTVDLISVADPYGRTGDVAITMPAISGSVPGKVAAGPFAPPLWNQGGGSKMHVDCSGTVTDLRMYAFKYQY